MEFLPNAVAELAAQHWKTTIQILLVAGVLYYAYRYLRDISRTRMVAALLTLLGLMLIAQILGLELIRNVAVFLAFCFMVVFQPELRHALVDYGRGGIFSRGKIELVEQLQDVVRQLSSKRFGALFAIERRMDLKPFLETGVRTDSVFSTELVMSIFHPKTALHDGGMIIRNGRIEGSGCVLPVSQREMQDRSIGLRHRAAMGITEETDAIAIVVSEETGHISISHGGEIEQDLEEDEFRERLSELLAIEAPREDKDKEEDKGDADTDS